MLSTLSLSALLIAPVFAGFALNVNVTGKEEINDADDFKFKTIITNTGDESVTLLNDPWSILTPKVYTNKYGIVSNTDAHPEFKGVHVTWMPQFAIDNKDFTFIEAGKSVEIEQDVSSVYDFSQSGSGTYKIEGGYHFQVVSPSGELTSYRATISPHTAKVSGKLAPTKDISKVPGESDLVKRAQYVQCTPAQTQRLAQVAQRARNYLFQATLYVLNLPANPQRFIRWFGLPVSPARKNYLAIKFRLMIPDAFAATYRCRGCENTPYATGYLAFVYKNQPYRINICNPFWNLPLVGADSQAGCIVHELSHFYANVGTDDIVYFRPGALRLAQVNPTAAIRNAANYQYFAENV